MGFLCGFIGAFLGAVVGIAAVLLGIAVLSDGNDFANAFSFLELAPVGLILGAIFGIFAALKLRRYTQKTWGIKSARRKTASILVASVLAVAARLSKYRHLLDSANVHRGFQSDTSHNVEFMYWLQGSAISSDIDKGYAYLPVPPKQALSTLDDCGPDGENMVQGYRHIEGNWYLYYKYLPG